jgi:CheY-like chemotaxis protein
LGLAIVKQLLLLFNSAIRLESMQGTGSTFSFDLSLTVASKTEKVLSVDQEDLQDLNRLKVLVAEDNAMNRILLTKIFSRWNCQPIFAENGQEAVDKLSSGNYDVVLMDLHMPVMDGYEAAKIIREMTDPVKSRIPIIALTASVSVNLNEKTKSVGMDGFILKPFSQNELYARLKAIPLELIAPAGQLK